jgi:hypothetical protein
MSTSCRTSLGLAHWDSGDGVAFTLIIQAIPFLRSLRLHKAPFAGAASPFSRLAPSLRFEPNRSLALANASVTNSLLPITAPAVKYLTRQRSIFAIPRSFKTVSLSLLSKCSAVFFVVWPRPFVDWEISARPDFLPRARPIHRRYNRETSSHFPASNPTPSSQKYARTKPSRAFLPLPFSPDRVRRQPFTRPRSPRRSCSTNSPPDLPPFRRAPGSSRCRRKSFVPPHRSIRAGSGTRRRR